VDPGQREQNNPSLSPDQFAPTPESKPAESAGEDLETLLGLGGETALVVVPVDPYAVHCQWEIAPADLENAKRALGVGEQEFWPVLRFYDVTNAAREEATREPSFATAIQLQAGNWFVHSCGPDRTYRADLALKREDGSFVVLARSKPIQTPPSASSSYADSHWLPIRIDPRQPESAIPLRSLIDLALEASAAVTHEAVESPVRLPIEIREEVRSMLATLCGERERAAAEPPLPNQSSLQLQPPIDMREEVRELLAQLYPEFGGEPEPPALAESPLFMEEPLVESVLREFHAVLLAIKPSAFADLTELNERRFTSGISSRTK